MSHPSLRTKRLAPALAAALACLPAASLKSEDGFVETALPRVRARALVERWGKHLVPVELWLRKSEGETPPSTEAAEAWAERRPLELVGLAVDAETIWLPEPSLELRFIARIAVGPEAIPARRHGWFIRAPGWILKCDSPLTGIEPIAFVPPDEAPPVENLASLACSFEKGKWTFSAWSGSRWFRIHGATVECPTRAGVLLVDLEKGPVGYALGDALPLENAPGVWLGKDLAASPVLTTESMEKLERLFAEKAATLSPSVRIYFRREEEAGEGMSRRFAYVRRRYGTQGGGNDVLASAIAVGPRRVLVHAPLDRERAMRLERVTVFVPGGQREARFLGAFKDYGVFLAEVDGEDLPGCLDLTGESSFRLLEPLIAVAADHASDKRQDRVEFNRVEAFERCFRNVLEPTLAQFPRVGALFFSAEDHALVGAAIEVRRDEDEWGPRAGSSSPRRYARHLGYEGLIDLRVLTVGQLRELVEKAPQGFDPRLRPVPPEREKDLVWFGVEYQQVDRDLARARGAEIATRGGEFGLLVLRVYPNSPAARGGLEAGDILLSLQYAEKPDPIELEASEESSYARDFLAELDDAQLDEVPAEYLSELPPPWPLQRNALNAKLTEIGEGNEVEIRYFRDGEEKSYRFALELGPPSFENAPKEKVEAIGLTVKDLTYEVRAHYRLGEEDPGVVVAKVESGGRAAVARIVPYERITSANGEPVRSAKEFREKAEAFLERAGRGDLELKVERLGKSRIVKIRA